MRKKSAAKSSRTKHAATKDLTARGRSVKGDREYTKHPAKVTVPDLK